MNSHAQAQLGAAAVDALGGRNQALRMMHPDKQRSAAGGVDAPPYAPAGALLRVTAPSPELGLLWVGLSGHRQEAPLYRDGDAFAVQSPVLEGTYNLAAATGGGAISPPVIIGPQLLSIPLAYVLTRADLLSAALSASDGCAAGAGGGIGIAHTPLSAVLAGATARPVRAAYDNPAASEDESGIEHVDVAPPDSRAFLMPGGDTVRYDAADVAVRPSGVAPGGVRIVYTDPPGCKLERNHPTSAGEPTITARTVITATCREDWHCGWPGQVVTVQPACGGYSAVKIVVEVPPTPKETQELTAKLTTAEGHTIVVIVVCTIVRAFPDVEAVLDRSAYRALIRQALKHLRAKDGSRARASNAGKAPQAPSKQHPPQCRRLHFA